jgi:antitoxin CcdA
VKTSAPSTRKRPVNITISEGLVEEARQWTDNLSATLENLLADYVLGKQQASQQRRNDAQACCAQWNAFNASVGSFADEHTTL